MDKIKVSKEVALALDTALRVMDKEKFFEEHSNKFRWTLDIYVPLNQISNWQMAQILINGYEIKKTAYEILQEKYGELSDYDGLDRACKDSFRFVLDVLEIKIKGIND